MSFPCIRMRSPCIINRPVTTIRHVVRRRTPRGGARPGAGSGRPPRQPPIRPLSRRGGYEEPDPLRRTRRRLVTPPSSWRPRPLRGLEARGELAARCCHHLKNHARRHKGLGCMSSAWQRRGERHNLVITTRLRPPPRSRRRWTRTCGARAAHPRRAPPAWQQARRPRPHPHRSPRPRCSALWMPAGGQA